MTDTDDEESDSARSYHGRVTLSGSFEKGFRATLPKPAAKNLGVEGGNELVVEDDTDDDELILREP